MQGRQPDLITRSVLISRTAGNIAISAYDLFPNPAPDPRTDPDFRMRTIIAKLTDIKSYLNSDGYRQTWNSDSTREVTISNIQQLRLLHLELIELMLLRTNGSKADPEMERLAADVRAVRIEHQIKKIRQIGENDRILDEVIWVKPWSPSIAREIVQGWQKILTAKRRMDYMPTHPFVGPAADLINEFARYYPQPAEQEIAN